jgi:tRNA pseudouridine38-40 synthase
MSLIRLTLEYDGTDFVGWQFQTNGRSVQEEVEKAIKQILQADVRIVGGGRTDSGVHARGQVASFQIEQDIDIQSFAKSLNSVLPQDVVVRDVLVPPSGFNARYSAKGRRYFYFISLVPTAIQRKYCWQLFQQLDIALMQRCAQQIVGEHGFRSFCKVETDLHDHQCTITKAEWKRENGLVKFEILANRFLHGMVRSLVGTMVNVGRGHTRYEEFAHILDANDRAVAGMSAPAKGLILEEILYA